MVTRNQKPKRSRFTLAPLYLAVGLVVCYFALVEAVPAMHAIAAQQGRQPPRDPRGQDWHGLVLRCSDRVRGNPAPAIAAGVALGFSGLLLPILFRPARYLVWLLALGVFALDIALVAGGYWGLLTRMIRDANSGFGP